MVSILPPDRGPWDVISRAIGQNVNQNFPGAVQRGYERQTGLNAIDQLQTELAQAGGDQNKILPALMRAYTNNQAFERSGLGPKYLEMAGAGQQGRALQDLAGFSSDLLGNANQQMQSQPNPNLINPIAQETQQSQPETAQGKKSANDIEAISNQYLGEVRPDLVNPVTQYGAINTFDSAIKQDLTPDEEGRLRQQLYDKYKNPDVVNKVIDRLREGIKTKYAEALDKYGFDKDRLAQIQKKWGEFTQGTEQRLKPHLEKFGQEFPRTKEILNGKYNQYAGAQPTNMTPEQMHTNSMALLQNDINKLDALHAIPSMPPVRGSEGVKEYIDTIKKPYKDLADQGFTEALKEDAILNKDMGNEEFHATLWGDQTSKPLLNHINSIKKPEEYTDKGFIPGHKRYNKEYPKQNEKYISDLSNTLKKLKPQDDLILARTMVLDGGGDLKDFTKALSMAQENGLKLSPFQESQLQEINIPRVAPLWEFFSGYEIPSATNPSALIGPAGGLNFRPFINYLRGKK